MKKNMKSTMVTSILIVLLLAVIGGAFWIGNRTQKTAFGEPTSPTDVRVTGCGEITATNVKIDVKNSANETGSEAFDVTGYLYKKVGTSMELVATIIDTTDPTATSVDCGYNYVFKVIGVDGASGDTSEVQVLQSGAGTIVDGNLEFKTTSSNQNFIVGINQHATIQCRAYDNVAKGLMFDSGDASSTDYEADGVTFTGTVNNETTTDETAGVDIEFDCKAIQTDTDFNDRGIIVLLELPVTTWKTPSVYLGTNQLQDVMSSLNENERKAYTDYEYAYLIPSNAIVRDGAQGMKLTVHFDLLDGIATASADPQVDLAVRTQYLSIIDSFTVKSGAVTDAASPSQIIAVHDITVDVTE